MLAGRKLLLADDSVTIQKVIDLTFADEGVRVVAFNNGQEAIDRIEEIAPDVVLADVFMPSKNGYQVCEYVKQNEKLKHIPVMLLVGSFEPFDEAEARRVGADDILTKPFQSIRRLIERVGALVGKPPAEHEIQTAELPKPPEAVREEEMLSSQELEITTADTQPLPEGFDIAAVTSSASPSFVNASVAGDTQMESGVSEFRKEPQLESTETLLDLGDFEPRSAAVDDDFVLDLEDTLGGNIGEPSVPAGAAQQQFVEPQIFEATPVQQFAFQTIPEPVVEPLTAIDHPPAYDDQVHEVQRRTEPARTTEPMVVAESLVPSAVTEEIRAQANLHGDISESLSPEMIDKIARRAVEMLSEKVVREICWEVVPELAELMIKRQLEEKESQPK